MFVSTWRLHHGNNPLTDNPLTRHFLGFRVLRYWYFLNTTPYRSHLAKVTFRLEFAWVFYGAGMCKIQFYALLFQLPSLEKTNSQHNHKLLRAISPQEPLPDANSFWSVLTWNALTLLMFWQIGWHGWHRFWHAIWNEENMQSDLCSDRITCM